MLGLWCLKKHRHPLMSQVIGQVWREVVGCRNWPVMRVPLFIALRRNGVHQTLLLHVPQIFQRCKSDANKQDFETKLNLTYRARSTPKIIGILTKVVCTFGPNLVILAWTGDELSPGRAQNGVNFDFEVKFDLEGQGQSLPKTIGILTKVFHTYGPNLVILAWTGEELLLEQAIAYRTHGRTDTDRQTQATTIPEGQNWPWVKISGIQAKIKNILWTQRTCVSLQKKTKKLCYLLNVLYIIRLNVYIERFSSKNCTSNLWNSGTNYEYFVVTRNVLFCENKPLSSKLKSKQ